MNRFLAVVVLSCLAALPAVAGDRVRMRRLFQNPQDGALLLAEHRTLVVFGADGTKLREIPVDSAPAEVALMRKGWQAAVCLEDGTILGVDLAQATVRTLKSGGGCSDLEFTPDGKTLFYVEIKTVPGQAEPTEEVDFRSVDMGSGADRSKRTRRVKVPLIRPPDLPPELRKK